MSTPQIVLFEDAFVGQTDPITLGRPAFAVTCAGYRLVDLLARWNWPTARLVRPHLDAIATADYPHLSPFDADSTAPLERPTLFVNASLVPAISVVERLRDFARHEQPALVRSEQRVAAAWCNAGQVPSLPEITGARASRVWGTVSEHHTPVELPLFDYPHDVIKQHLRVFNENIADRLARGGYTEIRPGVYVQENVTLGDYMVTDTQQGPILLDSGTRIGPQSYLCGPLYMARNCRILEHAAIKDRVCLGHTAKVGGEVETSIIEPYTNKQHHGFLGHSYLGSWVNLGAGTSNSDLKNTYGEVNLEYNGKKVATGMQFVGCMMGDYCKTAINTSIFTGKVIGSGSMLYGFVTTNVPSFTNYARTFNQLTEIPEDVLVATQARMFARRGVPQRQCDSDLLRAMHFLTRHERTNMVGGAPVF